MICTYFLPTVTCLFILLMGSFAKQIYSVLMRSNLSDFLIMGCAFGVSLTCWVSDGCFAVVIIVARPSLPLPPCLPPPPLLSPSLSLSGGPPHPSISLCLSPSPSRDLSCLLVQPVYETVTQGIQCLQPCSSLTQQVSDSVRTRTELPQST